MNEPPVMPLVPPFALLSSTSARPAPPACGSEGLSEDVRAAQKGDVVAFGRLYRAHVGRVYALCLRLTADTARAEALAQDSFVKAWERLATFRGESPFAAWLRQVTVNVVMGDRRASSRRLRRVAPTDDDAVLEAPAAPRMDAERLDLERAIRVLPETARTVFVLHEVEGYGHEEIASLMGIAEGTSKAHLHKARGKLQELLR
jgi:RNA polymerase sigma-70 factor (ECF subfamily)